MARQAALETCESKAARLGMRVEVVARERREPPVVVALAVVLDRARELEHVGRQYGIDGMGEQAAELRQAVGILARDLPVAPELERGRS